jgi:hypothetical protein|tara:strand:+ start:410 stop:652 length:243 start_codon:yes stop_codon:yes gene_type:complete
MTILGLNIKEIAIIAGFFVAVAGFYFSTDYRLTALEAQAADVGPEDKLDDLSVRLIRIEENLAFMRKDLDKIEKLIEKRR